MFYLAYGCEISRNARTTKSKFLFSNNAKQLTIRRCKQAGKIITLPNTLAKNYGTHSCINPFDVILNFRVTEYRQYETCLMP